MSVRLPAPCSRRDGDVVFILSGRNLPQMLDQLLSQDIGGIVQASTHFDRQRIEIKVEDSVSMADACLKLR